MLKNMQSIMMLFLLLMTPPLFSRSISLHSPDSSLTLHLNDESGALFYTLSAGAKQLVHNSEISLFSDKSLQIKSTTSSSVDTTWQPVWGQFSEVRDRYNQHILHLNADEIQLRLICRAYNDGIGMRFHVPGAKGHSAEFRCEYHLNTGSRLYWPNGEYEPLGPVPAKEAADTLNKTDQSYRPAIPLLVEYPDGNYLAILESDLFSAKGFNVMKITGTPETAHFQTKESVQTGWHDFITPWRVILVADHPGALVTSQTPLNLASPCKLKETDWIKAGKCLWDWRVREYVAPDGFTYTTNTATQKRFVDFASKNNILHHLLDWEMFEMHDGRMAMLTDLNLDDLFDYADKRHVGIALYTDPRHNENTTDKQLFSAYSRLGATLVKYGFKGNDAAWTRQAVALAAEYRLMFLAHDRPCPMIGIERTYPNMVTREYCHAQQDRKTAFTPTSFLKMAMINAVSGPLDQTNGVYDLDAINRNPRQASPQIKETLNTTVVSENARVLIIHSGMIILPDAPEAYEAKADLFEFIREMPNGGWDESHVLQSKIPEYITTARRKGADWFIGSVTNENARTLDIALDFLSDHAEYTATLYEDASDTHYILNRESYKIRTLSVKRDDVIRPRLAPGGGHCMWIRKQE